MKFSHYDEVPGNVATAVIEGIQLFFTFDAEKKAEQYLHLAEVRLAEYEKMIEKGKSEIAERTLKKYKDQLNRALEKAEELKLKSEEKAREVSLKIEEATPKHIQVLQENFQRVPEEEKEGLERAIEASKKGVRQVKDVMRTGPFIELLSPNGGETWEIGKFVKIDWRSSGVEKAYINLMTLSGSFWSSVCSLGANLPASEQSYQFNLTETSCANLVPADQILFRVKAGQYKIRVMGDGDDNYLPAKVEDESDKPFTVSEAVNASAWQTYRNEQYGFEVKYPRGVMIGF